MNDARHIDDSVLMLEIDGELDSAEAAAARRHCEACLECRERRRLLANAAERFDAAYRSAFRPEPPDASVARLRARMADAVRTPAGTAAKARFATPAAAIGAAAALIIVVGAIEFSGRRAVAGPLPDARLTPGLAHAVSRDRVCADNTPDAPEIPSELAAQVFRGYRIDPRPRAYEVDYLISPSLGGAGDIRNLWPQPYAEGVWTSRVKDALEDHLRSLVCAGRIELAAAQREIASDWIAAYQKYFMVDKPLPDHIAFVKDRPWE